MGIFGMALAAESTSLFRISIPAEWKFLVFIFLALFAIDLFVPFYLYADAQRRQKNGIPWAAGSFFTMAILAIIGVASGSFTAWVVLSVLAFLAPFVYLFVYLMIRTPVSQRVCPECGRALESTWRTCPFCEELETAPQMGGAGAAMAAGGPVFIPPSVPQSGGSSGTAMGGRGGGDRSTMVKPREERRTIRKKDKAAGPTLGWMVVKSGQGAGKEYKITGEITNIGREMSNEIVVQDDEVSRQHSRLRVEEGKFVIYDLGSANGTYVNDEQVQKAVLEDGDRVRVGVTELTFKKV
jgi:Inner membrane component of T3SS, cytoplasmic domain